jgi:hypothetical protein
VAQEPNGHVAEDDVALGIDSASVPAAQVV